MKLTLIWAMSENRIIGRNGDLPWHLPGDLEHFKKTTRGHAVIMGRKTWESLPGALPGRRNLVVSRRDGYEAQGAEVFASLDAALQAAEEQAGEDEPVFVLGGAEVYAAAMGRAEELYVTFVHAVVAGDTEFPELDFTKWRLVEQRRWEVGEGGEYGFTVAYMRRKKGKGE